MNESENKVRIKPTYYYNVEQILHSAGRLEDSVTFTETDPNYPVPFITEVTINPDRPNDTKSRVKEALASCGLINE